MSSNIDKLTENDIIDCPIHHCKPIHKYAETDRWSGWQTYCKKCQFLFDKMYHRGSGQYYHFLWQLSQLNSGSKTGSIFMWNNAALNALENADPSDLLMFDIRRLEYE